LVRRRVPVGEEPDLAAEPVIPPFPLHPGNVAAEVHVIRELAQVGRVGRARRDLACVCELVDVARPAVRAAQEKRHSVLRVAARETVLPVWRSAAGGATLSPIGRQRLDMADPALYTRWRAILGRSRSLL